MPYKSSKQQEEVKPSYIAGGCGEMQVDQECKNKRNNVEVFIHCCGSCISGYNYYDI